MSRSGSSRLSIYVKQKMDQLQVKGDEIGQGLIIGQNQVFIGSVPTPPLYGDDNQITKYKTIKDFDQIWISEHARQVSKLMYGGVSVVGIYLSVPSIATLTTDSKNDSLLWKILKSIRDSLISDRKCMRQREEVVVYSQTLENMHVLIYLRSTKQYILKSHDMTTVKYEKFKQQSDNIVFPSPNISKTLSCFKLVTSLSIQLDIDLNNTAVDLEIVLKKQIESMYYSSELKDSMYLVNGDDSLILPPTTLVKNIKKNNSNSDGTSSSSSSSCHQIDLLLNQPILKLSNQPTTISTTPITIASATLADYSDIQQPQPFKLMIQSGIFECKAYINEKETLETAINYLYQDLVGQFISRLETLFDQIITNNRSISKYFTCFVNSPTLQVPLPKRVSIGWVDHIDICDYLNEDEPLQDCKNRLLELLGLNLEEVITSSDNDNQQQQKKPKWVHSFESTKQELERSSKLTDSKTATTSRSTTNKNNGFKHKISENSNVNADKNSSSSSSSSSKSNTVIYILIPILMVLIAMLYNLAF
ncbi:hypothetical protein DFA_08383 [Cavenderia fasciculata]|uniref:Uncharacterized protein n=1 Tax=Cavenderia fasciculata TaxID=261658 RepID=F4Q5X9_CACFS|nr:uncharacterized protein DFA_08383 [Cavenderia fasciculata]EGG17388.1 hypothetical protein DFA_08383 [Cavenderia fasciculata]|eukprot:XP_004355872.1 hypothetical protein DFA_08383 [Cavenderia fasciculata]